MIKQGDRIAAIGLESHYPPYYTELFPNRGLVFVEYGQSADYVICGRDADVWDVDKTLYLDAWVMDQDVFNVLFGVYAQELELPNG